MSNPYGTDPYGQQNPPDPQQQHDLYGSMTGFSSAQSSQSAPDPYAQPDPYGTQNPYETANPYGAYGGAPAATAQARAKSPVVGVLGLIIGGLGVIVSLIMAVVGGNAFTRIVDALGTTDIPDIPPAYLEADYATFGLTFLVYLFTALPIFAGLILGIVSIATNRGRLFGVLSTILAVLGPIIVFIIFFVLAGPAALSNTPA